MPQHEVGYREWTGRLTSQTSRWWIIAETGFRLAFKSMWVKRLLFLAWLPIFYWGTIFFFIENPQLSGIGRSRQVTSPNIGDERQQTERSRRDRDLNRPPRPPSRDSGRFQQAIPEDVRDEIERAEEGLNRAMEESRRFAENKISPDQIRAIQLREMLGWLPGGRKLSEGIASSDPNEQRHVAWRWLLMTFFRYPQATMIIFLLGFISPGLISRDFRSRAFLLYFSRPIGRFEYIIGKLAVPTVFLLLVTTIPALILYALGVSLSPDLTVIFVTWDIPFRILLASLVLILPTATLSLMLSSLTHESRFASFAWFAVWLLGHGAWLAVLLGFSIRSNADPARIINNPEVLRWDFLSLYNNLGNVQSWIFGLSDFQDAFAGIIVLALLTIVSFVVLYRRVSAPVSI